MNTFDKLSTQHHSDDISAAEIYNISTIHVGLMNARTLMMITHVSDICAECANAWSSQAIQEMLRDDCGIIQTINELKASGVMFSPGLKSIAHGSIV